MNDDDDDADADIVATPSKKIKKEPEPAEDGISQAGEVAVKIETEGADNAENAE